MSEHTIDQHDIELPELPKDEDERRLDEIAEVIHDFLGTKESESLEAQSATYSQEEQVIDRRIESQERVQALETDSSTTTPRPTPTGLQQARTVRNSAAQRRPTPAARYAAEYVQRAQVASGKLTELADLRQNRQPIEKYLNVYGTSLDEFFLTRLAVAGMQTNESDSAKILSTLGQSGWSADKLCTDLRTLAASAAPGQQADIATAVEVGEGLLTSLTAMRDVIVSTGPSSNIPFMSQSEYRAVACGVAFGVARTLGTLASGQGIRPWTKAQRCHDLASRFSNLEDRALGLDSLQGAEERQARLAAYLESGRLNLDSTDWSDTVTRARKAVADLNINTNDLTSLDKALKRLGPDLDAPFDALRRAIEDLSSPASIENVIALGWEFTRQVASIIFQLEKIGLPAFGADAGVVLRDLQNTLAKLAGYLTARMSVRGGLTTT